jgi:hypothetical protein
MLCTRRDPRGLGRPRAEALTPFGHVSLRACGTRLFLRSQEGDPLASKRELLSLPPFATTGSIKAPPSVVHVGYGSRPKRISGLGPRKRVRAASGRIGEDSSDAVRVAGGEGRGSGGAVRAWADPVAAHMAAFTAPDHMDRDAFERRWTRLRADETVINRVIVVAGEVAGTIGSWGDPGEREVTRLSRRRD